MENLLTTHFKQKEFDNKTEFVNYLREFLQIETLIGLSKSNFFKHAAFYGGTSLRIFHNLDRFSEDLDFTLIDNKSVELENYVSFIRNELLSKGIDAEITIKNKTNTTAKVETGFIKVDLKKIMEDLQIKDILISKDEKLQIKIDLSIVPLLTADTEIKSIFYPSFADIRILTLPSLFASKIYALLNRNYIQRVKGRDYYDYYFYIANNVPFDIKLIKELSNDNSISEKQIISKLKNVFEDVDIKSIKENLQYFVENKESISNITNRSLLASLQTIKSIS